MTNADRAEGADFREAFADVGEGEVGEGEEGTRGDERTENGGEAGALVSCRVPVFEDGFFGVARSITDLVPGFGADHGRGA